VEKNYSEELRLLGLKIRESRLSKKMTQSDLASYCDVDIRTIQRIEKGDFNMSLRVFFSICESLKIKPEVLIVLRSDN